MYILLPCPKLTVYLVNSWNFAFWVVWKAGAASMYWCVYEKEDNTCMTESLSYSVPAQHDLYIHGRLTIRHFLI